MKTQKAKEKAKTKAKAKVAKKCGKTKKAVALVALLGAIAAGCQSVPSRSQTLTVRDCVITIYGCGSETNNLATVEIATQAMSIENSGSESLTPTQTTDTKPDIDVTVGGKASGGGLLESVASSLIGSSSAAGQTSTATAAATDTAVSACSDGSCSVSR